MPARSRKRGRRDAPERPAADTPPAPLSPRAPAPAVRPRAPESPTASAATATAQRSTPRYARPLPDHLPPPQESRSERRNAEVRATLRPYAPGERPAIVIVCALISAALALVNLISWLAGVRIAGHHAATGEVVVFVLLLGACAVGLWLMRAGAVLGFMCLMAILAILFTLFLVEASNVLGVIVAVAIILVSGYLFFKLVRVLSRLQAPRDQAGA